jgi:TRAP-type mannitol/chloroaromatic compound transport system permease small subunit
VEALRAVKDFIDRLTRLSATVGMIFVIPLMLITTADVVGRGFFNKPIAGTFELSEYMLAVIILLGAAYTQQVKGHVAVDFLTVHFGPRTRVLCRVITTLFSLAIVTIVVWQGFKLALEERGVTDQLRVPKAPFRMLVGIGGLLLWLQLFFDLVESVCVLVRGRQ